MTAGWHADPTGRHLYRYHDGSSWTEHVADGGSATTVDPYDSPAPAAPAGGPLAAPTPGTGATAGWSATPTSSGPPPSARAGTGGGWSTGAKIGAVVGALAALGLAFGLGFVAGAASGFVDALDGFSSGGFVDDDVDDAVPTGVVFSSDMRAHRGTIGDAPLSFEVRVTTEATMVASVVDADWDTTLTLLDPAGEQVAYDDDGGDSLLSRLTARVGPGTYTLVLSDYGTFGADGPYELVVDLS